MRRPWTPSVQSKGSDAGSKSVKIETLRERQDGVLERMLFFLVARRWEPF